MVTLDYIDDYFMGRLSGDMKKEFEAKISDDPLFAEEVAFYLSAKGAIESDARMQTKERFNAVYKEYKTTFVPSKRAGIVRRLWPAIAAAAILASVIIGWVIFNSSSSPADLANEYTKENWRTLGVTMSTKADSLQTGIDLYNQGKLNEALSQFEAIISRDTSSTEAIKFAGIVALQSNDYNKALKYFEVLENWPQLRVNYGKFYHALTLMKRGQSEDTKTAKELLKEIDQKNLDGKTQARVWLGKF
ncbi:MAG: hypothetical protein QM764_12870 [Chitinophagaceae bacterium]